MAGIIMRQGCENPEQLILGIAHGLDARTLEPFILSLRRSGYQGRTRIFVGRNDRGAAAFLVRHGIEVENFDAVRDRFLKLSGTLRLPHVVSRLLEFLSFRALEPLATREWGHTLYARLAPADATVHRYILYRICLAGPAAAGVRRIFLVDTRDVIFQRDPFDFDAPAEGLVCFLEESRMTIGRCATNSAWVRACYGDREVAALHDRGIFNSGATVGERSAIERYLDAMISEIARVSAWPFVPSRGFDQACHNHLLHRAPPAPFVVFENGAGPVIHLDHRPKDRIILSTEGLLLDNAGRVVNVVHQWDRHTAAFQPVLDRLRTSAP